MLSANHAPFSHADWIYELKYDGHRAIASNQRIVTRKHADVTERYSEILGALQAVRGSFVIDGELCALNEKGIPDFERMQKRSRSNRGAIVTFFAFDILFDRDGNDVRGLPLLERKKMLKKLLPAQSPRVRYVDYEREIGEQMFAYAVQIGMEGVVGKRADSLYKGGDRKDWVKFKPAGFHDGWERPLSKK